jgi:ornithine carbamoyltransferase
VKRDFLHITDFTADEIHETFALAKEVKARFKSAGKTTNPSRTTAWP